jgi:hypothetical protein
MLLTNSKTSILRLTTNDQTKNFHPLSSGDTANSVDAISFDRVHAAFSFAFPLLRNGGGEMISKLEPTTIL